MVAANTPVGILAYDGDEPVAWCSIAPLETYTNLRTRSYVSDGSDTEDVWSIACFYIRSGFRRQGLTTPLIEAAIDYARDNGAKIIEAYPVDYDSPSYSYMGRIGTFERLGFQRDRDGRHSPSHHEIATVTRRVRPHAQSGWSLSQRLNRASSPLANALLASNHD